MREVFPYPPLSGDVTVHLGDVLLDDLPADVWADVSGRTLDLSHAERAKWRHLRVPVTVVGPPSEIAGRRVDGGDPRAHLVVQCGPTNARQSVRLEVDASGARWTGVLELERPFWFGRIEVAAHITDLIAENDARRIGSSEIWQIQLDDLPASPVSGELTVRWANFDEKEPTPAILADAAGEPYYHYLDSSEPVLYLNLAFPGLEPLLRDGVRAPAERAVHDQVRSMIATKFFLAAASAALTSIAGEGDPDAAPEWPDSDWQRDLLVALLRRMYPKQSADDALREVRDQLKTEDGAGAVETTLIRAVDQQVGASRLLRTAIEALGLRPEADAVEI
jgi:hypothetical protein